MQKLHCDEADVQQDEFRSFDHLASWLCAIKYVCESAERRACITNNLWDRKEEPGTVLPQSHTRFSCFG